MVAGTLADIDDLGVLVAELCEVGGAQAVVDEYVGGCQEAVARTVSRSVGPGPPPMRWTVPVEGVAGCVVVWGRAASWWVSSTWRATARTTSADRLGLGEPVDRAPKTVSRRRAWAGMRADPWGAQEALMHQIRRARHSSATAESTAGSPVAVWTSQASSRSSGR